MDVEETPCPPGPWGRPAEELARAGPAVLGWATRYLSEVGDHPVLARVEPGWVRAQLPEHPPETPEAWEEILADLDRVVVPGTSHWQSPRRSRWVAGSGPSRCGP